MSHEPLGACSLPINFCFGNKKQKEEDNVNVLKLYCLVAKCIHCFPHEDLFMLIASIVNFSNCFKLFSICHSFVEDGVRNDGHNQ